MFFSNPKFKRNSGLTSGFEYEIGFIFEFLNLFVRVLPVPIIDAIKFFVHKNKTPQL
jgi:hypothetical protein